MQKDSRALKRALNSCPKVVLSQSFGVVLKKTRPNIKQNNKYKVKIQIQSELG